MLSRVGGRLLISPAAFFVAGAVDLSWVLWVYARWRRGQRRERRERRLGGGAGAGAVSRPS